MEFKEAVHARRTIRSFQPDRPVEAGKIHRILDAARLQSRHGNAQLCRRAIVVTKGETPDDLRDDLIDALYNQPQAAQAPVAIVWIQDLAGWKPFEENRARLRDSLALPAGRGWSEELIDNTVLSAEDLNVAANPDLAVVEWLISFECGLAVGSALLAAVDEGLGTGLITGRRAKIRKMFNMPASATPTQVQLVGYPAENQEVPGSRSRAEIGDLYFAHTWGNPLAGDLEGR